MFLFLSFCNFSEQVQYGPPMVWVFQSSYQIRNTLFAQFCFIFAPSSSKPVDLWFALPRLLNFRGLQVPKLQIQPRQTACPEAGTLILFFSEFWKAWYALWTVVECLVNHRHPPWITVLGIYPVDLTHCLDLHLWIYIILISIFVFVYTCAKWLQNAAILVW